MNGKFDQVYKKYLPEALPVLAALGAAARIAAPAIGRGLASAGRGLASAGRTVASKGKGLAKTGGGVALGSTLGGGGSNNSGPSTGGDLSAPVTTTQAGPNLDKLAGDLTNVSDSNKVKEILAANLG